MNLSSISILLTMLLAFVLDVSGKNLTINDLRSSNLDGGCPAEFNIQDRGYYYHVGEFRSNFYEALAYCRFWQYWGTPMEVNLFIPPKFGLLEGYPLFINFYPYDGLWTDYTQHPRDCRKFIATGGNLQSAEQYEDKENVVFRAHDEDTRLFSVFYGCVIMKSDSYRLDGDYGNRIGHFTKHEMCNSTIAYPLCQCKPEHFNPDELDSYKLLEQINNRIAEESSAEKPEKRSFVPNEKSSRRTRAHNLNLELQRLLSKRRSVSSRQLQIFQDLMESLE